MRKSGKRNLLRLACCLCLVSAVLLAVCGLGEEAGTPASPVSSEALFAPESIDLTRPEGGALDLALLCGQQNGPPPPARPGSEMTEQELIDTAKNLLCRASALYSWAWNPDGWQLDFAAPLLEDWQGEPRTLYPLLDFANEAQLRAVYASIFSEDALRREEERARARMEYGEPMRFQTRQGRLYADPMADGSTNVSACDSDTLRLVGASEDAAVLEAEKTFPDGEPMGWSESVTLLRKNGRWVLAGPLWDMPLDNRFVPLPAGLAELAQRLDASNPDAAFQLRQAARLGQALAAGDAAGVNRCMVDRGGEPPMYDAAEYAFADLSGLRVSDWQVELEEAPPAPEQAAAAEPPAPKIWLRLVVDDPGKTPLHTGSERYLLSFHNGGDSSFDRGCVAALWPESENQGVNEALLGEAARQTRLLRGLLGREEFSDLANEEPLRLLCYLMARLRADGLCDENGGVAPGQLADAPQRYLGLPMAFSQELMLNDGYTFENGRWYAPGRGGYGNEGPEPSSRFISLAQQGDTVLAALRFYRDAQCLSPACDLLYTFRLGGSGDWQPVRCERVQYPPEG